MPDRAALARTLARRLPRVLRGEVLLDPASRLRAAAAGTPAGAEPLGVVVPADDVDVVATLDLCRELGVPIVPRGAGTGPGGIVGFGGDGGDGGDLGGADGTARAGDGAGAGLVIDASRRLTAITDLDPDAMTVDVEPGVVLDRLNARLAPHGLCFPIDLGASAQATIGGMAGANARGARSLAHGDMVHQVLAIDALLADGTAQRFGPFGATGGSGTVTLQSGRAGRLVSALFELAGREATAIDRDWPRIGHAAGGYALDSFHPRSPRPYTPDGSVNLAHLLVGSQGTLAWSRRLTLRLARLPAHRGLGVLRFDRTVAMARAIRALVALAPSSIDWIGDGLVGRACADPRHRPLLAAAGLEPVPAGEGGWLVVEFSGDDAGRLAERLRDAALVAEEGGGSARYPPLASMALQAGLRRLIGQAWGSASGVAALADAGYPSGAGGPWQIGECALPLARGAEGLEALQACCARAGLRVDWQARVSAGTLHLRPRLPARASEPAAPVVDGLAAVVREQGGVLAAAGSGGPAAQRAAIAAAYGPRLGAAFAAVKSLFDPQHRLNPGWIVAPAGAAAGPVASAVATPATAATAAAARPGGNGRATVIAVRAIFEPPAAFAAPAGAGWHGLNACDGNGLCRKDDDGLMCPSFRLTGLERDAPRGRIRTVRAALAGRFGPLGLAAPPVAEAFDLCVGCKGCRVECPSGIDLARVKLKVVAARAAVRPPRLRERLFGGLPDHLAWLARLPPPLRRGATRIIGELFDWRERRPGVARFVERRTGLAAGRRWPRPQAVSFLAGPAEGLSAADESVGGPAAGRAGLDGTVDVILFADTFNNGFEPGVLRSAIRVLGAAGYRVGVARPAAGDPEPSRPLCCGRARLAIGQVDAARAQAARTLAALAPWAARGVPIVGLEPACLLTLRDEWPALGLDGAAAVASAALLFEEFLDRELAAGRCRGPFAAPPSGDVMPSRHAPPRRAVLVGHCQQRACGAMDATGRVLGAVPGLAIETVPGTCCGMAGAFGFEAEHHAASLAMAGQSLLPALAAAGSAALVVADGFDCRLQIRQTAGLQPRHVAEVLADWVDWVDRVDAQAAPAGRPGGDRRG